MTYMWSSNIPWAHKYISNYRIDWGVSYHQRKMIFTISTSNEKWCEHEKPQVLSFFIMIIGMTLGISWFKKEDKKIDCKMLPSSVYKKRDKTREKIKEFCTLD